MGESTAEVKPIRDFLGLTRDQFKHAVALLIAALAFFGTLVAALQVDAGARSSTADRDSRALMLQGIADTNTGTLRYAYEIDMLVAQQSLFTQWGVEMRSAQENGSSTGAAENRQAAQRYIQIANDQRTLSTLLSPPYYDDKTGNANVLQFDADGQVKLVAMAERQAAKRQQADAWGQKGNNYTITLTVLAVCAFLFGLAVIAGGGIGYLFVAVGNVIAAGAVLAVVVTCLLPVPYLPDQAIQDYAQGFGDAYVGQKLEYYSQHQMALQRSDQAIAALSKAIDQRGDYASAYVTRGDAHIVEAQALTFSRGDQARLQVQLDLAAADYRRAIDLGHGDKHTYWNLGYTYFLAKKYDQAISVTQQALKVAPDQRLGLGMNMAIYTMGLGKRAEGMQQLEDALTWAEKHHLASDWYYLRQIVAVLEQLQPVQPIDGIPQAVKRIKEAFVSLTYKSTTAVKPTGVVVGPFTFEQPVLGPNGEVVERKPMTVLPRNTERVDVAFDFDKMPAGALVVQKVYDDQGNEKPLYTRVETWSLGSTGHAEWSVQTPVQRTLAGLMSGPYVVDLYVEGELVQSGRFTIE